MLLGGVVTGLGRGRRYRLGRQDVPAVHGDRRVRRVRLGVVRDLRGDEVSRDREDETHIRRQTIVPAMLDRRDRGVCAGVAGTDRPAGVGCRPGAGLVVAYWALDAAVCEARRRASADSPSAPRSAAWSCAWPSSSPRSSSSAWWRARHSPRPSSPSPPPSRCTRRCACSRHPDADAPAGRARAS